MKNMKRGLTLIERYLKCPPEDVELMHKKIKSIGYDRKGGYLNFTILVDGKIIFLRQKPDKYELVVTGNGAIKEEQYFLIDDTRNALIRELLQ